MAHRPGPSPPRSPPPRNSLAAAELARRNGSGEGFRRLAAIPHSISAPGKLLSLFAPDRPTKPLFTTLLRAMRLKQNPGLWARIRLYWDIGWTLLLRRRLQAMVDNGMGICTGMAQGNRSSDLPLSEWLSAQLDQIAELRGARPLTFGDLWSAPFPPQLAQSMTGATSIQLQLVSTCLTFGRPYALPHLDRRFAFSPKEFRRLFPDYVVDYMVQTAQEIKSRLTLDVPLSGDLLPLPVGEKLPVIVAVRMSLSFPGLFCTVPLYYPNLHGEHKFYEQVHFADGGITSNLPVHFFDSPFPRWPTLAVNLQYTQRPKEYGRADVGSDGVWLAKDNRDGTLELFNRFLGSTKPIGKVLGLVSAIFRSAQVWNDNSFLVLPGYRDRIAEIWLDPHEGGMNLEMSEDVIKGLIAKGDDAGRQLVARFAAVDSSDPMSWDGHRWARYRSIMPAMATYLRQLRRSIENPIPGDRSLWELLARVEAVPSYRFKNDGADTADLQRQAAVAATHLVLDLAGALDGFAVGKDEPDQFARPFCDGPRPPLTLHARASLSSANSPRAPVPSTRPMA